MWWDEARDSLKDCWSVILSICFIKSYNNRIVSIIPICNLWFEMVGLSLKMGCSFVSTSKIKHVFPLRFASVQLLEDDWKLNRHLPYMALLYSFFVFFHEWLLLAPLWLLLMLTFLSHVLLLKSQEFPLLLST